MLIFILMALVLGALASAGLWLRDIWQAVPQRNQDFEWLEG